MRITHELKMSFFSVIGKAGRLFHGSLDDQSVNDDDKISFSLLII